MINIYWRVWHSPGLFRAVIGWFEVGGSNLVELSTVGLPVAFCHLNPLQGKVKTILNIIMYSMRDQLGRGRRKGGAAILMFRGDI